MTAPLLSIANYTLDIQTFDGPVHVLKNINLHVIRGETLGIVGESGSGKTVLVRSILGIGPKQSRLVSGQIDYDGIDLVSISERGWKEVRGVRISMIFQDPMTYLNPLFSIGRQISDVVRAHQRSRGQLVETRAVRRTRAVKLLTEVGIHHANRVFDQFPHQLSGGMRQRVLIAMALIGEPELLIADEPTTALDVTVQAQVLALIKELVDRRNLTVIIISHDIGAVATLATRCAVMYKGEIVEQGKISDILHTPQHDYTKQLLDSVPEFERDLERDDKPEIGVLLEARELTKVYGSTTDHEIRAVDGVSFSVKTGDVLGIVGESGSGKSTIARLILRLIEPTSGSVHFDGTNLTGLGVSELQKMRRHMQMVFQNPHSALNGRHTIEDAVGEPLRLQTAMSRTEVSRRVEELLDIVQLPRAFKYRYPHELSGGQKQRVCIARAVSLKPKLMVLDEPTSALDVSVQAQILDFLKELRLELDLTYVFISHDLAVVREICDSVLVMRGGVIVERGPTDKVFFTPEQDYTRSLIESARKTSKDAAMEATFGIP